MVSDALKRDIRRGYEFLEQGDAEKGKRKFRHIRSEARRLKKENGPGRPLWVKLEEVCDGIIDEIEKVQRDGSVKEFAESLKGRIPDYFMEPSGMPPVPEEESGIKYQGGVGEDEVEVTEETAEEVFQDRIEFYTEELRKSNEDLLDLKQELDELKEEEEEED